jgi:Uma2 family endonuclease
MVTVQIRQLQVPRGQRILLTDISWSEFEEILREFGEKKASRLAYYQGTLEIKMPLPEHERVKVIIGDLLKILLAESGMDWESFGSTTFQQESMVVGIEPDDCFYIQNYRRMIEVDITSTTRLNVYEALGVSEIWKYENRQIKIYRLQEGEYQPIEISRIFPEFPILESFSRFLAMSSAEGTSSALRSFRLWVRERFNTL